MPTQRPYELDAAFERTVVQLACASRDFYARAAKYVDPELLSGTKNSAPQTAMRACHAIARETGKGPGSSVAVCQRVRTMHERGEVTLDEVLDVLEYTTPDGELMDEETVINELSHVLRDRAQRLAVMELTEATIRGGDVQRAAAAVAATEEIGKPSSATARTFAVVPSRSLTAAEGTQWLIAGLVPRRGVTLLVGEPFAGKSSVAAVMSACVAAGEAFAGREVEQGRTLYVSADRGADEAATCPTLAARAVGLHDGLDMLEHGIDLANEKDVEQLVTVIKRHSVKLLVLDCLRALASGIDENSSKELAPVRRAVTRLAEDCAVVLVHHSGRSKPGRETRARGSSELDAMSRSVLVLTKGSDESLVLRAEHHRRAEHDRTLHLRRVDDGERLSFVAVVAERAAGCRAVGSDVRAVVQETLLRHGPLGRRDLDRHARVLARDMGRRGAAKQAIVDATKQLVVDGVVRNHDGKYELVRARGEEQSNERTISDPDPVARCPVPAGPPSGGGRAEDYGTARTHRGRERKRKRPETKRDGDRDVRDAASLPAAAHPGAIRHVVPGPDVR